MDKGYNSESIHHLIREEQNVNSIFTTRFRKNELVGVSSGQKWMNISMKFDIADIFWLNLKIL